MYGLFPYGHCLQCTLGCTSCTFKFFAVSFKIYFWIFIWKSRVREGKMDEDIFYPLAYSSDDHCGWNWTQLEARSQELHPGSSTLGQVPKHRGHPPHFPVVLKGSLVRNGINASWTSTYIVCQCYRWQLNLLGHNTNTFLNYLQKGLVIFRRMDIWERLIYFTNG